MKNGIRSAWQSGRSPSQNSIDEASAASPSIRQLKNPGVARLKCVLLSSGYPCYVHSSSVRDKDEVRATPQVRSTYTSVAEDATLQGNCKFRGTATTCPSTIVLESTFGTAPQEAILPRLPVFDTVSFGLAFALDFLLWACSSQFGASISLICTDKPSMAVRRQHDQFCCTWS